MKYEDSTTRNLKRGMMCIATWPWLMITRDSIKGRISSRVWSDGNSVQPFHEFRGRERSEESRGGGAVEVLAGEDNLNQFNGEGETEPRPAT